MPILFLLVVAATCLPVAWPPSPFGFTTSQCVIATTILVLIPVALALILSRWVTRTLRDDDRLRPKVVARYNRLRRRLGWFNLGAIALAIGACGWGWVVWHSCRMEQDGSPILIPGAELLVPVPYFLLVCINWMVYYPAERQLHRSSIGLFQTVERSPFWSFPLYMLFHLRQFLLMVALPLSLFVGQQSLARVAPELTASTGFQIASVVGVGLLFLYLPRAVKPILGLRTLPNGPERSQLEAVCRRMQFRYTDLLLWPTQGAVANAMVLGMLPSARYVVFTDRLLQGLDPSERDAVLGHEIGHIYHRHIIYYSVFFILSMITGSVGLLAIEKVLVEEGAANWLHALDGWTQLVPIALMVAYLFLIFGLLSRRCERQADIFGCRATSCGDRNCTGHDATTTLNPAGGRVCPAGVRAMVHALERVMILNGASERSQWRSLRQRFWAHVRAWQHGPLPNRIHFLLRLLEEPDLAERTDVRVARFRRVLLAGLLIVFVTLGSWVGWETVWRHL